MRPTPHSPARPQRPSAAVYRRRRIAVFGGVPTFIALFIYILVSTGGSTPPPAAASHHQSHTTTHHATASSTIEVGVRSISVTDTSRSTYNYATGKSTPGRTLTIEVRYPTRFGASAKETTGAKPAFNKSDPLVIFAPGFRLQPSDYGPLLDAWVKAGFVVAAIDFPDTTYPASEPPYTAGLPHGSPEADLYSEPADVAFAAHQLLTDDGTRSNWLRSAFDPKKLALAGHSDGASVMASLAYDSTYAVGNLSIRAVLALSGGEFAISGQHYSAATANNAPLLVVQSAADLCAAPFEAVSLYDTITSPKVFLKLDSATHLGPYDGSDPAAPVVQRVTSAFLTAAFSNGGVTGDAKLLTLGASAGISAITDASAAAAIPTPTGFGTCPHD